MADEGALVQGSIRVVYKGCKACIPPETECRGHVLAATDGGDVDTVLRALTTYLVPEAAVRAEAAGVDVVGVVMVPEACSYCFGAMVLPACPYCFRAAADFGAIAGDDGHGRTPL